MPVSSVSHLDRFVGRRRLPLAGLMQCDARQRQKNSGLRGFTKRAACAKTKADAAAPFSRIAIVRHGGDAGFFAEVINGQFALGASVRIGFFDSNGHHRSSRGQWLSAVGRDHVLLDLRLDTATAETTATTETAAPAGGGLWASFDQSFEPNRRSADAKDADGD